MAEKILEVNNLTISFKTDNGLVRAVRGVSFDLERGETLCIVGESGSGKSVTSKAIMGILAGNAVIDEGQIIYQGENLLEVSEDEFYKIRGKKIGMIFQDPLSSLNPIVKIGKQITEAMLINSDKLKIMYDDLISAELIKYKNCIAKCKININTETNKANKQISELEKKYKESIDEEERKSLKNQINSIKLELKTKIKSLNAEKNSKLPELKQKLDDKKVFAKQQVKEYKQKLRNEYLTTIAPYSEELHEFGFLATKFPKLFAKENAERISELKSIIEKHTGEYTDKIKITKAAAKKKALEIMKEVGIPLPEKRFNQYPFEFSGGMRQRIVIAIALIASPEILICDEPTTALDVTIQAQILELIKKIQKERNIACIFITHDLGVVANMADRVAVMYAGKIVEYGNSEEVFFDPRHPYTWALLSSIPDVDSKERLEAIPGTPPNMIYPPKGDAFALRSRYAMNIDFKEEPPFFKVSETHYAKTWLLHPNAPKVEMPRIVSERIKNALRTKEEVQKDE
jgi:oligopeptide transport system ATP-binding protein